MKFLYCSVVIVLMLLSTSGNAFSQITEKEKTALEEEALVKLTSFMNYVKMIGNKGEEGGRQIYDDDTKQLSIERAVNLFKDGAMMEVSSHNRDNTKFYTIEHYLYRLKDSLNYDFVDIKFDAETIYLDMDNIVKVPNKEMYIAVVTVVQVFEGSFGKGSEVNLAYKDEVKKIVELVFSKEQDPSGPRWLVVLGDVSVSETKKL